jgi:hypothetical protein
MWIWRYVMRNGDANHLPAEDDSPIPQSGYDAILLHAVLGGLILYLARGRMNPAKELVRKNPSLRWLAESIIALGD